LAMAAIRIYERAVMSSDDDRLSIDKGVVFHYDEWSEIS
jgi:hypothetical protein